MLGQRRYFDKPVLHFPHLGFFSTVTHRLWRLTRQTIKDIQKLFYIFVVYNNLFYVHHNKDVQPNNPQRTIYTIQKLIRS